MSIQFFHNFLLKIKSASSPNGKKIPILAYLAALLTVGTVLGFTWVLNRAEQDRFDQQKRTDAQQQLSTTRARLEKDLNQRLFLSRGLVAYISAINPNITQQEFENLTQVIVAQESGIRSVALYKNTIISHMYPLKGNESTIGFDPRTIPGEKEAIENAIANRLTIVAGPLNLLPEGIAFIARTPIFLTPPGQPPESGSYWGMVGIIIDQPKLFKSALLENNNNSELEYAIRGKDGQGAKGEIFFGRPEIFQENPVTSEVTLPNGSWFLAAVPVGGWSAVNPIAKWFWLGGSLLSVFAGGFVFILVSAPTRLREAVNRATAALRQSEEALKQANNDLRRLDQLKDEFLANTSHELRTPLNGIIGLAESLIDGVAGPLLEKQRKNLMMIVQSGHRLSNLVNDILDFSQLKHKDIHLQIKPVGIKEIADIVCTFNQTIAKQKQLELVNLITGDLPLVAADENRVQQILYNLVGNSLKFTDSGSVKISAELVSDNNQIAITVSDTGIGIPADKFDRIFESFEQADGSTAREYGGTGLGLAVTKKLVELHGGKITVTSTVGVGSQFTFTLPVFTEKVELAETNVNQQQVFTTKTTDLKSEQSEIENQGIKSADLELGYSSNGNGKIKDNGAHQNDNNNNVEKLKILIVDDEPINLQVLENHLSLQEDYAITQAINGMEALTIIEHGFKPDLILLDVMMPRMTGYEVTQKLRDRFPATELPILLLTAKNQVQDLVQGLNVGANDYLTKPIAKDELIARIKTHINLNRLRAENLRLNAELEVTRRLQTMILPKDSELNNIENLDIAGYMEPAEAVGGDYYDVIAHPGGVKIAIGDVTGHGLESGVVMLMAQTAVRTLIEDNQTDYQKFLNVLNKTIYNNIQRMNCEKSMTLSLLDYQQGNLVLSGQHEEIIVVRNNGELERIDTIDLGFPIGLDSDISDFVNSCQVQLQSGDIVVLYTDGITEAENIDGELYGIERLCEIITRNSQKSAREIRYAVITDLETYIGNQQVYDDITLVVIKQK